MKATLFAGVLLLSCAGFSEAQAVTVSKETSAVSSSAQTTPKINLNKASAQELTHAIPGIGKKRAEAIVAYREKEGLFKSVEDLSAVRGFGKKFVGNHLSQLQEVFVIEK